MEKDYKYRDINEAVIPEDDGCTYICEIGNKTTILTGTTVYRIPNDEISEEYLLIKENYGIYFICNDTEIDIDFYCVPLIDFFAFDDNGYYGTLKGFTDIDNENEICYVDKDGKTFFVEKNLSEFAASLFNGTFDKSKIKFSTEIEIFKSEKEARKALPFMPPFNHR